jgi:NADH-quinone oxidoreductase subunit N
MIFVGLETLSIAAYVLAAYHRTELRSIEAGMKYFLMGSVASAFLLLVLAFMYGSTGSLDLFAYRPLAIAQFSAAEQLYALVGLACLLAGFGFKLAAVPFQWWAPDVYTGAPLPVTAWILILG